MDKCDDCNDWGLLNCTYVPDDCYPQDSPNYADEMKAKRITFETMRNACYRIYEKAFRGEWKRSNVDKYAQAECLRKDIVRNIWNIAKENRSRDRKQRMQVPIPAFPVDILPTGLNQNVLALENCMVGIMHTLILNLGRHLLTTVIDVSKEKRKWPFFKDCIEDILLHVQGMSLSWCKALGYSSEQNPASSWVSENYLAFSILAKSLSSMFIIGPGEIEAWEEIVFQTLSSYNSLVSRVMFPHVQSNDSCDLATGWSKAFLSHYNELDSILSSGDKSKIETASCMLNVIEVGEHMKRLGIMRNYWEGSLKGEAYIQIMKPYVKRGVQMKGTPEAAMKKCYSTNALDLMIDDLKKVCNPNEDTLFDQSRYRRFHSYRNGLEVREAITCNAPIAAAIDVRNWNVFVIIGWGRSKICQHLRLTNETDALSTICYDVDITKTGTKYTPDDFTNADGHIRSCILLPLHENRADIDDESECNWYYIFTEDHEEIVLSERKKYFPQIHVTTAYVG